MPALVLPPTGLPSQLVSWAIVEETLDDAVFLWQRRDGKLAAHDWTLSDLENWVEDRLVGAVEGLVVAGDAGVDRFLGPGLTSDEPSHVAVSSYALLSSGMLRGIEIFKAAFLAATDARLLALGRGLELAPGAIDALAASVKTAPEPVLATWLGACAFQQRPTGRPIGEFLGSRDVTVQRVGARLLRFADHGTRQACQGLAIGLADAEARDLAVESLLIGGLPQAWPMCRDLAGPAGGGSGRMLLLLAMIGAADEHKIVLDALGDETRQKDAIWALGFGGRRAGADACLDFLAQGRHEKLAAEAFSAITGLDLAAAGLVAPPPGPEGSVLIEDEDLPVNLSEPEDLLPAPDVGGDPVVEPATWPTRRQHPVPRGPSGHPRSTARTPGQRSHAPAPRSGHRDGHRHAGAPPA